MDSIIRLRDFCRAEHAWLLETIEHLVRLESPSDDKAAVDCCGAAIAARLTAMGGRVSTLPRTDRGDHLLAEFGCGTSQILLLGHFDTVWPVGQLTRMPAGMRDGRLHGPGVFDMKTGVALGMLATRALLETGADLSKRIVMLWTTDEEVGSATSRQAIEDEARRSDAVLVLEPSLPGGMLKTSRKGVGTYELIARGIAAHAGVDPTKGASAIHELAHQIGRLSRLPDQSAGISVNVGLISGGSRSNVIAEQARAVVDARAITKNEMEMVDGIVRRLGARDSRVTLEVTGGFDRPPLERTEGVERLFNQARSIAREMGGELTEGSTGGGSDGNFTAALGVPTLDGLGAIGDGAHALHEHVEVDALPDRAALIAGLIRSI
ncbi:MAG TPA: M20 family metallopeptidase [Vicinamibacterales bacterium]|nr:M20 family metallopeptidase [Vicinamibacterales bacterium]